MQTFKNLYYAISYSRLIAQAGFVITRLYNKIVYERVLYYDDTEKTSEISQNYFDILRFLLYTMFALMISWAVLTPLAVIANKQSKKKTYIPLVIGALGLLAQSFC